MRSLTALLRIARRDARRDRWRTVLVVALVALPVAGLVGGITFFDTITPTPEERVRDRMGSADAVAFPERYEAGTDPVADLGARLPEGTILEARRQGTDGLVRDGQRHEVRLTDAALASDALGERYRVVEGRAPGSDTEVALTPTTADALDLGIGDVLALEGRGESQVVGLVRRPEYLDERMVLVAPGTIAEPDALEVLIDLPEGAGADALAPVRSSGAGDDPAQGWFVDERVQELSFRLSGGERWFAVIVGGLAAVEVALIAGAAFAVSVRRRQRELGLLAAVGGTRRDVRRVVLLTGVTVGVVGAVVGVAVGVLALVASTPWMETFANREVAGLRIDPLWLTGVALLGILSATLGAWWPARSVAALPVTVALSGRRPAPEPSVRGLRAGIVVVLLGGIVTMFGATLATDPFVFLAGSVLLVLGAGLTSPWLLEQVGRIAPRLPAGPRLALRDAARFRTRNGPIVTAAMAGLAASISIATVVGSMDASASRSYEPSLPTDQLLVYGDGEAPGRAVAAATSGELAGIRQASVEARPRGDDASAREGDDAWIFGAVAVGTPELARALGGELAVQAIAAGDVVLLGQEAEAVELWSWDEQGADGQPAEASLGEFGAVSLPTPGGVPVRYAQFPTVLVPPEVAVETTASAALVSLPAPIDDATYERAVEAAGAATAGGGVTGGSFVVAERGYQSPYANTLVIVLTGGALAGLLVVSVAIALAAAEARSDLRTLTAVGASGRTRRSLAAGRAALLAGIGGTLAVPVGLVPGAAIIAQAHDATFAVPWVAIGTAVVLVPLLATAGAVIASGRSPGASVRVTA